MSCVFCVDNFNRPGAPEYHRPLRLSANRGCNCPCGQIQLESQEALPLLGRTVARASLRWERPTADPRVTLMVN